MSEPTLDLATYDRSTLVYDSRDRCQQWSPFIEGRANRPSDAHTRPVRGRFGPSRCWLAFVATDGPQRWSRRVRLLRAAGKREVRADGAGG